MGTVRVLFCLLCGVIVGCGRGDSGGDVKGPSLAKAISPQGGERMLGAERARVVKIAVAEIGVKEVRNNDGKRVREYLAYTGIKTPAPWCSAFLSWVFGEAGYSGPKTAWSPAMFPKERLVYPSQPSAALPGGASEAMVIGIYFSSLKRIGHVGLIERLKGELIYSIEGNTNTNGSREGHGVFRKVRHLKTVSKVADWIN